MGYYDQNKGRVVMLKSWKDKRNDKADKTKGFKTHLLRNNSNSYQQCHPYQIDSKMVESLGKRETRNPIMC